jgi:hypothetical protein
MASYEHYGQTLTTDNLSAAIQQAVDGHPQVPMQLHPMDGVQWIDELADALDGQPLGVDLGEALTAALSSATPDELDVLGPVADRHPQLVDADHLRDALLRSSDASTDARRALGRGVARAILDDRLAYDTDLRRLEHDTDSRAAIAPAYLCNDHEWFMAELPSWFSGDEADDRSLLLSIATPLSRGELLALADEVDADGTGFSDETRAQIVEYVNAVSDRPYFADRGDDVRWRSAT